MYERDGVGVKIELPLHLSKDTGLEKDNRHLLLKDIVLSSPLVRLQPL